MWVLALVKYVDSLPKDRSCDVIANQLLRSGTSVGANYVEAQAASSKKDFTNFTHRALKSANESKYWLALLRDLKKGDAKHIERLLEESQAIANILAKSLMTLKNRS